MKRTELRQMIKEELLKERSLGNDPYDISEQLSNLLDQFIEGLHDLSKHSDSQTKQSLIKMKKLVNSLSNDLLMLREDNDWI